jgi:N utilization substance protein B
VSARHKARKRALDVLFEADQRKIDPQLVLDTTVARRASDGEPPLNPYVGELIAGVLEHQEQIDELLNTYSLGWSLDRMPSVDRCVLRLGAYEVLFQSDVPDGVAIAEAVELAADHSTDDSPAFVNGLLARLAKVKTRIIPTDTPVQESSSTP